MSIDVERVADRGSVDWDDHVAGSEMGTVFHRSAVLDVLETHADATVHSLVGYKGQEVVGLFPIFELRKGPVSTVFSPPPRHGVPSLGPVSTNYRKLKRKKRDRRNKRFVDGCLDWLADEIDPKYTHVETVPAYDDVRPFQWAGYEASPRFTYELDLTRGREAVFEGFKGNLRSHIRRHEDEDYEVFEGGVDAIDFILEQVRARFEAQDKSYEITTGYVADLYEALPDGQLRPYIGSYDGEWLGGVIVPSLEDRMFYWQGGGKPDAPVPINDLIHWRVIRDGIDRGVETYDLTGANTHRISEYKAKFNPNLVPYYEIEQGTRTMNVASDIYRKLR